MKKLKIATLLHKKERSKHGKRNKTDRKNDTF